MKDVISIGTVAIDLYFKGTNLTFHDDRFQLVVGGKYFADYFYEGLGGGAANVAIGLHKLGIDVGLAAKIGDNAFKHVIFQKLHDLRIDYKLSEVTDKFFNISCVLLSPEGDRSIVNYRSQQLDLLSSKARMDDLADAKLVYLANMPSVTIEKRTELFRFLKKRNIATVLNLGTVDCSKSLSDLIEILELTDVLLVNAHEFAELIDRRYVELNFEENLQDKFLPNLSNVKFIITDGLRGSFGYVNGETYYQKALKAKEVVDATGAGDGYTAGFIAEYIKTDGDVRKAMHAGANYAIKIVERVGAN